MATANPNDNGNRNRRRHESDPSEQDDGFQAQAEQWSRKIGESAQSIWWAGLGALQRAQAEGRTLFDTLVQEGAEVDRESRQRAEGRAESVRDEVEQRFDQARDSATNGWNRIERAFDEKLRAALRRLDVPEREELDTLRRQVQTLRSQVSKLQASQRAAATNASSAAAPEADDEAEPGPSVPPGI
ncbi:MAG TPA: phasin family protein [Stenotrophomonas sp.]|jgi:poly(hydroxyalkanoate) granule-associated protein